jgi:hypothetical protein
MDDTTARWLLGIFGALVIAWGQWITRSHLRYSKQVDEQYHIVTNECQTRVNAWRDEHERRMHEMSQGYTQDLKNLTTNLTSFERARLETAGETNATLARIEQWMIDVSRRLDELSKE